MRAPVLTLSVAESENSASVDACEGSSISHAMGTVGPVTVTTPEGSTSTSPADGPCRWWTEKRCTALQTLAPPRVSSARTRQK